MELRPAPETSDLRTHTAQPPATELFRLEATRGGNRVVQLRALLVEGTYAVECQVDAVDGRRTEARSPLRHSFATQAQARAFADEAAAALQYLGCHVRAGG